MGAPGLPVTPDLWSWGIALQPALLPRGALPLLQALLGPRPEVSLPVYTRDLARAVQGGRPKLLCVEELAVRVGAEQLSPGARAALCRKSTK